MENPSNDVNGISSPVVSEDVTPQTQLPETPVVVAEPIVTPPKGSQTPPEHLYAALAEERRIRKELEDKLNNINTTTPSEDVYSDEGKLLQGQISTLTQKLSALEEEKELEKLFNQYPLLKEKESEFKEYRNSEHPRAKLESVAKLYLAEEGLLDPVRKGLEKPTGGPRTPVSSDMTPEDVKHLRETDYRKYTDMLKKGLIKV